MRVKLHSLVCKGYSVQGEICCTRYNIKSLCLLLFDTKHTRRLLCSATDIHSQLIILLVFNHIRNKF